MADNKVVRSIEADGGQVCVDIFHRPDGSWGFEEYRREPEDGGGWFVTGFHGARRFAGRELAWEAARRSVRWLGDR